MSRLPEHVVQEVKLRADIERVIGRAVKLKRKGVESIGLCPFHNEKTASFSVNPRKRFFFCFGCAAHGDAIRFVMRYHGLEFNDAVRELAADLGIAVEGPRAVIDPEVARQRAAAWAAQEAKRREEDLAEREKDIAWCRRHWDAAKDTPTSLALTYLKHRGLALSVLPVSIRCQPLMSHAESGTTIPCMVAGIQSVDRMICGIHRTFLSADGRTKTPHRPAKKMNGQAWGGAVRLSMPAASLVIGEGIETVLSVMEALDGQVDERGQNYAFWAALSLGNLAGGGKGQGGVHPTRTDRRGQPQRLPSTRPDLDRPGIVLPPWARTITILADADNGDPEAAEALLQRAANRFRAEGREVRIARPPDGTDFNDVMRGAAA